MGSDTPADTGIASPWSDASPLPPAVVVAEALGVELSRLPLGRDAAMQIPAAARARGLVVSSIAPLPLVALDTAGKVSRQPTFLYRSNTDQSVYDRLAWTVDDLIWYGTSLWALERGARTGGAAHGPILDAYRVPRDRWQIKDGRILVNIGGTFQPADREDVLLFTHHGGGILNHGAHTLRAAHAIEAAYVSRAQNPLPLTVIEHTPGSTNADRLEKSEVEALLAAWKTARQKPDGALGYLPPTLKISTPGADATDLMQDARNASRIDLANHFGLPVTLLDGGVSQESMTYRNAEGEVSRYYRDLATWTNAIEARLSQDDVVPRGQRVRFDLAAFDEPAPPSTGVPVED